MFRPSMRKEWTIISITILSFIIYFIIENTTYIEKSDYYKEKLEAARLAQKAMARIKDYRFENKISIDDENDPLHSYLIGQEITLITTDRGSIESKLLSLNPNFAAAIVEMMREAGLKKGDKVAAAFTGSFPALNISTYAAAQVLGLDLIPITSVGASNWGATDPEFTWLDMEKFLRSEGFFGFKSVAASIGGKSDNGRGLSPEGRELIKASVERNEVKLINNGNLLDNINDRIVIYKQNSGEGIKCYINVGGGLGSLGASINGKLIDPGLTINMPQANFPTYGAMIHYAMEAVPIIHLLRIEELVEKYNLSPIYDREYLIGEGNIYYREKYNLTLTVILAIVLFSAFVLVLYFDQKSIRLDKKGFHPEELL